MSKINICGILFDNVTMDQAISAMEEKIKNHKNNESSGFLFVANQDIINRMQKIKELTLDGLNEAFLTIPDGYSIVYAAKFLKTPLKERVTGPDLMEKFMELSNSKSYKHFFLGAKEGVGQKLKDNFLAKYPQIKIVGVYSPPFCDEFSIEENQKIIDMINNSYADVLWVSFGCPKQEKWILQNKDKIKTPISVGIGAAFDFHSGNLKRAPKWVQNLRMEWFYRFLQEPKRLWKRYFVGGFNFLTLLLKEKKYNRSRGV